MSDTVALIDGDSFIYRAAFSVEKTKYLVDYTDGGVQHYEEVPNAKHAGGYEETFNATVWSRREVGSLQDAKDTLDRWMKDVLDSTGVSVSNRFVYLSPTTGNFRTNLATLRPYKGGRRERPVYYDDLRNHLVVQYAANVAVGEEADDKVSWMARYHRSRGRDCVVVSIDKDLRQIPGRHYDWVKREHFDVSDDDARVNLWAQVLVGDLGDNIGGCYKVGAAKAMEIIVGADSLSDASMWSLVVDQYRRSQKLPGCPYSGMDGELVALENLRLVRLKQTASEPLWVPPINQKNYTMIAEHGVYSAEELKAEEGTTDGPPLTEGDASQIETGGQSN